MDNPLHDIALQHFGGWEELAAAVGRTRQALQYRVKKGRPLLTAEEVLTLEQATDGALTRQKMRPDLWPAE